MSRKLKNRKSKVFFVFIAFLPVFLFVPFILSLAFANSKLNLNNHTVVVLASASGNTQTAISFDQRITLAKRVAHKLALINQTTGISNSAPEELNSWFSRYGTEFGVSEHVLRKIAKCESTFKPQAKNGPFAGLFQFLASTWASTRKLMNLDPNPDLRFNPEEAIKTAAFKISRHGTAAWPVCRR
jgi:soluble lytic murein transglycosylase-like protein